MSVAGHGCGRKSDSDNTNQSRQAGAQQVPQPSPSGVANSNLQSQQPAQPAAGDGLTNQSQASQQPTGSQAPQQAAQRQPSFLDDATGTIKDVPFYPNGQVTNVFHGPQPGVGNMMRVTMQTTDPLDKIQAFYEKAAKSKGWNIISKTNNGEQADLLLTKGGKDDAGIIAKRDYNTNMVTLVIVRTEKTPEARQ